jgi:CDP-paratose 2-epimerase
LTESDASVHVFDNLSRPGSEHNLHWLHQEANGTNRLRSTVADVRDRDQVQRAVRSATEIYHFAAQVAVTTSLEDPRTDFEVNAGGTFNILEAARPMHTRPFLLFTSTNKVYGHIDGLRPLRKLAVLANATLVDESQSLDFYSPYGCSKGTADQYVHDYARIYGLPTVVFRMSCIAGPRQFGNEDQGWVAHFAYSAMQDNVISIYGDGTQVRDVLAVGDLVRAFDAVQLERNRTAGQVFNVGGGPENAVSLLGLIAKLEQATGRRVRRRFYPTRPGDQHVYITDFSKLREHVQWSPNISVDQTVAMICKWWRDNRNLLEPTVQPISTARSGPLEILPEVAS